MDVTPTTPQPRPSPGRGKPATAQPKATAAPPTLTKVAVKPVRRRKAAAEPSPMPVSAPQEIGDLNQRIALTAYFLSEARNFEPGHELEDWLEAERRERAVQQQ